MCNRAFFDPSDATGKAVIGDASETALLRYTSQLYDVPKVLPLALLFDHARLSYNFGRFVRIFLRSWRSHPIHSTNGSYQFTRQFLTQLLHYT
jgi:hypothetical protein